MKIHHGTPGIVKHKTTNTELIEYINKHNCEKGLTI